MICRYATMAAGLLALIIAGRPAVVDAAAPGPLSEGRQESVSSPLAPYYTIRSNGSVALRICFNWSCARRQTMTFSSRDMALVREEMAVCSGKDLYSRLQRLRVGIWQMELLARKYQPLLGNDRGINDFEFGVEGRTDCVDNATNTTTFLHILQDFRQLPGWSVARPRIRGRFNYSQVHWTAVVIDTDSGEPWSIDSWYRPHGHLPMVMPLPDWLDKKLGWDRPLDRLNPTPYSSHELCDARHRNLSETTVPQPRAR
jgi:hypothetical protein